MWAYLQNSCNRRFRIFYLKCVSNERYLEYFLPTIKYYNAVIVLVFLHFFTSIEYFTSFYCNSSMVRLSSFSLAGKIVNSNCSLHTRHSRARKYSLETDNDRRRLENTRIHRLNERWESRKATFVW